jgi:hypothetical protein
MKEKVRICKNKGCKNKVGETSYPKYCSGACYSAHRRWLYPKACMLKNARQHGVIYSIPCTITEADIPDIPTHCPIFKWMKLVRANYKGRAYHQNAPSLDRISPAEGYVPGNVRIISWRANAIKNDATTREAEAIWKDHQEVVMPRLRMVEDQRPVTRRREYRSR